MASAEPSPGSHTAQVTDVGRAHQQTLVGVHEHLRGELAQVVQACAAVAGGELSVAGARDLIQRTALRQHAWELGAFCAAFCRVVTVHHTIEDRSWFPGLRAAEPDLAPAVDRLEAEHERVAALLADLDAALVAAVGDGDGGGARLQEAASRLSDVLLAHLADEEETLLPALGRLTRPL